MTSYGVHALEENAVDIAGRARNHFTGRAQSVAYLIS
jgi:hypothetical protein